MGMCLIIWDKLFGSFQQEINGEPVKYGLTKPIAQTNNPLKLIFNEWRNIASDIAKPLPITTRLKYLLMPPGWSHDGSSKTAKQLRATIK
jgi:hypothetical protein